MAEFINGNEVTPVVPYGSSSNSGHNYSTEEKKIGTWIDGKPIYEKTLIFENLNDWTYVSADKVFEYALSNVVNDIDKTLFAHCHEDTNNSIYPIMFFVNSTPYNKAFFVEGGKLSITINSGVSYDTFVTRSFSIVVQYTKTTDSAEVNN